MPSSAHTPPSNGRRQDQVDHRLGKVEQELGRVTADMRVMGHELQGVKADLGKVAGGVDELLKRDRGRPEPKSLWDLGKAFLLASAVLAAVAIGLDYYVAARLGDPKDLTAEIRNMREQLAAQRLRLDRLDQAIAWTPKINAPGH